MRQGTGGMASYEEEERSVLVHGGFLLKIRTLKGRSTTTKINGDLGRRWIKITART